MLPESRAYREHSERCQRMCSRERQGICMPKRTLGSNVVYEDISLEENLKLIQLFTVKLLQDFLKLYQ